MIALQPKTLAELHEALGEVPFERIIIDPPPGMVTEEEYLAFISKYDIGCELVDGTIVTKDIYPAEMLPSLTMADLHQALGEIPLERIRMVPPPGTATDDDLLKNNEAGEPLCELIDGTLVEKAMGMLAAFCTITLARIIGNYVVENNLGFILPGDGPYRMGMAINNSRLPDLSFVPWSRVPLTGFPSRTIETTVPTLAVESLSPSNTRKEMKRKRKEYFVAGVELVWMLDPDKETVDVYTSEDYVITLTNVDTLDGGTVLPGFSLPVASIFTLPQRPTTPN